MAIAFVAAGTPVGGNTGVGSHTVNVPIPAGLAVNQFLIMAVAADDNTGPATPSGWHKLTSVNAGTSTETPFNPPPHGYVFWKIATGSEGASVPVTFAASAWPAGTPYYAAAILSYSGTDLSNPITEWATTSQATNAKALNHSIITTTVANDWLLTFRWGASDFLPGMAYSISGGTNSERIDTNDNQVEQSLAMYDSNGALATGVQTQRITTAAITPDFGSVGVSIAIRVPTTSITVATPSEANGIGTAFNASVVTQDGPWQLCASMPAYSFRVDWAGNGTYTDPGDDVTADILDGGVAISFGRDQSRQLSPTKTGTASFSLNNSGRNYSPENAASPMFGDLDPARTMAGDVVFNGTSYALGRTRIDDYNITADMDNRSLDLSFLDGMKTLDGNEITTGLLRSQRTGDLINYILDQIGWTGPRSVDPGATIVPWWWLDNVSALTAVQDLVKSEGPPSIAYVALDGTFVFRDRHHRLLYSASLSPQASYVQGELGECASPSATGLSFTAPFQYAHGWRDIVNTVNFSVDVRAPSVDLQSVWSFGSSFSLTVGETRVFTASGADPFVDAVTPVAGTDYTTSGAGSVVVTLFRSDGASSGVSVLAVGGPVTVSDLQLRARPVSVVSTVNVSRSDSTSIDAHGVQTYPDAAPWAGPEDAYAVAGLILLHYAKRRPTVQLRLTASDPRHLFEILSRQISDRVHITYGEMSLDDDFFIETITHGISRMNAANSRPPVHYVVFGCEKNLGPVNVNPFRFDTHGAGFDQGVFDPQSGDNPNKIFVWDDPRGSFDVGVFGT